MSAVIPVITLHGTPFERGRQHGTRFRAEIAAALAAARTERSAASYEAARRQAAATLPLIEQRAPAIAAELNGIAAGAGSDPIDVLLRSGFELFGVPAIAGCSAIAVGTPDGALVAQNWDAPLSFAPGLVLFLHFGPDGFEQAIIASYGGLCWVGCNRHGLAFVNNDLMLATTVPGLPSQVVRRLILREESVPAALDLLRALPHMAGRSYLLGDAAGAVAGVEVAGARRRPRQSASQPCPAHQSRARRRHRRRRIRNGAAGDLSVEPPSLRGAAAQAAGTTGCRRHRRAAGR